jgi:hypothetical protein
MPIAHVAALGATRRMLGFSRNSVSFEGGTVGDLLRQMPTKDGGNLYDRIVCDGRLRSDFAVVVDGLSLKADELNNQLHGGEHVVTMAILRTLAGG